MYIQALLGPAIAGLQMPDVQMTLETISERTRFNLRPILITVMIAKRKMICNASK
jgi:hypothetical protein